MILWALPTPARAKALDPFAGTDTGALRQYLFRKKRKFKTQP